ncbi:hypothetical protein TNCT_738551 [Trichonephila clavata]|uniref:Uncharacterized protein n=1 Tax=Trichonephila clavata TaxID=2740835 RepID=A0A8X6IGP1_TRICU|nr:hypothetical protein TNCT_738551 [Trichonephila clavata]
MVSGKATVKVICIMQRELAPSAFQEENEVRFECALFSLTVAMVRILDRDNSYTSESSYPRNDAIKNLWHHPTLQSPKSAASRLFRYFNLSNAAGLVAILGTFRHVLTFISESYFLSY